MKPERKLIRHNMCSYDRSKMSSAILKLRSAVQIILVCMMVDIGSISHLVLGTYKYIGVSQLALSK